MRQLLNDFKERLIRYGYKPCSTESMVSSLKSFLTYAKTEDMRKISPKDIEQYKKYLMTEYIGKKGRRISAKTVAWMLIAIKKYFGFLTDEKEIFFNPTLNLKLPKYKRGSMPQYIPTEEDIEDLLLEPDTITYEGIRDRAIMELSYTCPLRNKEIRELTLSDIDLKDRFIYPKRAKGGRECGMPIADSTYLVLQRYLEVSRPRFLKCAKEYTDALFLNQYGKPFKRSIGHIFRKYRKNTMMHTHSMRHACAVHMLKNGAGVRDIQVLLGHRLLTSTQIYTRLTAGDLKDMQDKYHPRERKLK